MIDLYTWMTPNGRKISIMLEELGLPYNAIAVNIGQGEQHDPDWWVKRLVEREQIPGVLPPSLQLRKDDAELDARLDTLAVEREARREVEDFNARVIRARYTPVDGPPLITMPRDVEATVEAWATRRADRAAAVRAENARSAATPAPRRRWWRRGR